MKEHLGWHFTHLFPSEFSVPNYPRATAKVEGNLCQTIVHWQTIAVTFHSAFISKGKPECFSEGKTSIFNGMVFVNFQIPIHLNSQIHSGMTGNLVEHVVKKSQPGMNVSFPCSVQIQFNLYFCFFGIANNHCSPVRRSYFCIYFVPVSCNPVSYTHLRAHETRHDLVCRLLLEKKKKN